jgi:hypothetical protein
MLTALAALVLIALGSEVGMAQSTTCSGKTVTVGQDLDAIVNADPQNTATTFCLASGEYPIDNTTTRSFCTRAIRYSVPRGG